ncbi:nuclear transport factor 2 family protein [Falsiroseomonas tokyonensis]|uniref:Nuclear transport factor 2 family protein n=1 Tax=Falsiroseomonas tokyonensis TaxID=430521 RepID=A0ABV7C1Q5_9PROT|nr:nuclear transport factor 2 family protein [Falsiroseomonas tokyonensis]MBU8540599.1 nuclear transport factor 2 family protein [Falsiroseomonas tokyonensis]
MPDAIQEVMAACARMGLLVDLRDWAAAEALFAPEVRLDYTSLFGGAAQAMSAGALIQAWRGLVPGFTRTQHTIGLPAVEVAGEEAWAMAPVLGHHFITDPAPEGGDTWLVGGRYEWRFTRIGGSWRIAALTLANAWQQGNAELPRLAAERAATRG